MVGVHVRYSPRYGYAVELNPARIVAIGLLVATMAILAAAITMGKITVAQGPPPEGDEARAAHHCPWEYGGPDACHPTPTPTPNVCWEFGVCPPTPTPKPTSTSRPTATATSVPPTLAPTPTRCANPHECSNPKPTYTPTPVPPTPTKAPTATPTPTNTPRPTPTLRPTSTPTPTPTPRPTSTPTPTNTPEPTPPKPTPTQNPSITCDDEGEANAAGLVPTDIPIHVWFLNSTLDPGDCDDVTIYLPNTYDPAYSLEVRLSTDAGLAFNNQCTSRQFVWSSGLTGRTWYSREFPIYACATNTGKGTLTAELYHGKGFVGSDSDTAVITSPPTPTPMPIPVPVATPVPEPLLTCARSVSSAHAAAENRDGPKVYVWLPTTMALGKCYDASVDLHGALEEAKNYAVQLATDEGLAFNKLCSDREATWTDFPSSLSSIEIATYACVEGQSKLTATLLVDKTPQATAEATTVINQPTPMPTIESPGLPESASIYASCLAPDQNPVGSHGIKKGILDNRVTYYAGSEFYNGVFIGIGSNPPSDPISALFWNFELHNSENFCVYGLSWHRLSDSVPTAITATMTVGTDSVKYSATCDGQTCRAINDDGYSLSSLYLKGELPISLQADHKFPSRTVETSATKMIH